MQPAATRQRSSESKLRMVTLFGYRGRSHILIRRLRILVPVLLLVAMVSLAGCKKKQPPPPAATAPPSIPAPTAQLTATPSQITAGDQVTLSWRTTDATSA